MSTVSERNAKIEALNKEIEERNSKILQRKQLDPNNSEEFEELEELEEE